MAKSRVFPFTLGWMLVLVVLALSVSAAFGADGVYPPLPKNSPDAVNGFIGQEGRVSSPISPVDTDRWYPRAAYDSNNRRHLVVWHDDPANGKMRVVRGQLLDQNSQKIGDNFVIAEGATNRTQPVVVFSPGYNKYLVVYMRDTLGALGKYYIVGKFIGADGATLADEFEILKSDGTIYMDPEVAWNSDKNRYMVVAEASDATTLYPSEIVMALVGTDGQFIDSTTLTDSGLPTSPTVTFDKVNKRYLVAWQFVTISGKTAIQGDLRNSEGSRIKLVDIYSPDEGHAYNPRVTSSFGSYFLVVWEYVYSVTDHDIYVSVFSSDGQALGSFPYVFEETNDTNPDIAGSDFNLDVVVVFQREYDSGSGAFIMMPGSGTPTPLCDYQSTDCFSPAITYGGGRYISVFVKKVKMNAGMGNSPLSPLEEGRHVYEKIIHPVVVYLPHVLK